MSLTSLIDLDLLSRFKGKIDTLLSGKLGKTENAYRTASIPMGQCDSTSTATAFTATVDGITELRNGVCVWLRNNVITSASGFTININNLGAKPVYQSMAAAGRITTLFNINYTVLLIYNSTRVEGGCWDMVYGYNSDTNTIAYQIRRNNGTYTSKTALGRYMLCLSYSPTQVLPINALDNTTGTSKTLTTTDFDPHGPIWYYSSTTAVAANGAVAVGSMWASYNIDLRYSFNTAKTLTTNKDIYIVATPQSDGRAKLHSAPISQTLPSTEDGKIYIYLGHASSTYNVYLAYDHPIYYYKNGSIRRWTGPQDAIPTKTSDLTNDSGFLTSYTETDPTVPSWAKASSKPSYTKSEVGLGNVDNVKQYSASNPPPYPVTSVNGNTGAVTISVPTKTSDLINDSNFATTSQVDTVVRSEQRTTDYRDQLVVSRNGSNYYFPLGVSYFFFVYDLEQERFTNVPPTEVVDYAHQTVPMVAILDLVSGATHNYYQLTFCEYGGGCSFTYQDDVAVYVVWRNDDNWEFVSDEPGWVIADAGKVDKETGKGLSTNDYTTTEKNKLAGIASSAQVNVIETVKRNGTALTVTGKAVDISVPTKTSDLTNDSGFGTYSKPSGGIPKTDLASAVQTSLGKADTALQTHQSIKTINGNSLVGTGDITIGSPVSMTDMEVEAAFTSGWGGDEFTLDAGDHVAYGNIISVTTDGTYGSNSGVVTSASEGDTVTVMTRNHWAPIFSRKDTEATITTVTVTTNVYSFVMPGADVLLDLFYDD